MAEATLAANLMGMAIHFVDLAENVIEQRIALNKYTEPREKILLDKLAAIKTEIDDVRKSFYAAIDASWVDITEQSLNAVSHKSRQLARVARTSVDELYPYCGLVAASPDTEINRVWRDLHTASQHTLLVFES